MAASKLQSIGLSSSEPSAISCSEKWVYVALLVAGVAATALGIGLGLFGGGAIPGLIANAADPLSIVMGGVAVAGVALTIFALYQLSNKENKPTLPTPSKPPVHHVRTPVAPVAGLASSPAPVADFAPRAREEAAAGAASRPPPVADHPRPRAREEAAAGAASRPPPVADHPRPRAREEAALKRECDRVYHPHPFEEPTQRLVAFYTGKEGGPQENLTFKRIIEAQIIPGSTMTWTDFDAGNGIRGLLCNFYLFDWLFPVPEGKRKYYASCRYPILTQENQREIREKGRENVRGAFCFMLRCYGLKIDATGVITPQENQPLDETLPATPTRSFKIPRYLGSLSYNMNIHPYFNRIEDIITSLRALGCEKEAGLFLDFLRTVPARLRELQIETPGAREERDNLFQQTEEFLKLYAGAVFFNFEKHGVIQVPDKELSEETLFEAAVTSGAEDFEAAPEGYFITTEVSKLYSVKEALEAKGISCESAEIECVPKNLVACSPEDRAANLALIDGLEAIDDINAVYHNMDMSE